MVHCLDLNVRTAQNLIALHRIYIILVSKFIAILYFIAESVTCHVFQVRDQVPICYIIPNRYFSRVLDYIFLNRGWPWSKPCISKHCNDTLVTFYNTVVQFHKTTPQNVKFKTSRFHPVSWSILKTESHSTQNHFRWQMLLTRLHMNVTLFIRLTLPLSRDV